jgi:TetR/AcrR family transcriptional regulator, cholesterol catabolism regulator
VNTPAKGVRMNSESSAVRRRGNKHTRARKAEVLNTAAQLFYRKGYNATAVQDIADELGMLKGSVYYYMDSKEDLLFEIIMGGHVSLLTLLQDVMRLEELPPREQLREFIRRHTTFVAENLVLLRIFFDDFRSLSDERRATVIKERDQYDEMVRSILTRGQESGAFHRNFDPKIVAMGILGMTNWVYQWFREDGALSARQVGDQLADLAIDGVDVGVRP